MEKTNCIYATIVTTSFLYLSQPARDLVYLNPGVDFVRPRANKNFNLLKKHMKNLLHFSTFVLVIIGLANVSMLSGCTKDNSPATSHTVTGLWTGTQKTATSAATSFTMSIKADGTATYENILLGVQQFCAGTWTLSGTTLTCNTTCIYGLPNNVGVKQTFTATYNPSDGTLSNGQWENTYPPSAAITGTFSLTEVN